jgi:hypothetical protein
VAFTAAFGSYSVEGTLNEWFHLNLTGAGIPAWMPSARVLMDFPEVPLISGYSGHAFALAHVALKAPQLGGVADGSFLKQGVLQVSTWVSKQQAGSFYMARLRQMSDMVSRPFFSARAVQIKNLYTGAGAPTAIDGVVRFVGFERLPFADHVDAVPGAFGRTFEANPDLMRFRHNIVYEWRDR